MDISSKLDRIASALEVQSMGFGSVLDRVYIKAGTSHGWYRLKGDVQEEIPHSSIAGYVKALSVDQESRDGEATYKMHLTIWTGSSLVRIESGNSTYFSKRCYLAIAHMTPEQLKNRVSICLQPGKKAVFCDFLDYKGDRIPPQMFSRDEFERNDFRRLCEMAIANINGVVN